MLDQILRYTKLYVHIPKREEVVLFNATVKDDLGGVVFDAPTPTYMGNGRPEIKSKGHPWDYVRPTERYTHMATPRNFNRTNGNHRKRKKPESRYKSQGMWKLSR
tara:strand:- start:82 stop:396 length:315 start_codon:yes stop_codon:yes gene_type:complete